MTEKEMSAIVSSHLIDLGYEVWAEVPVRGYSIDLVAIRPDLRWPVIIELKRSLTKDLIHQLYLRTLYSPFCWGVVASQPRRPERVERFGLGLATIAGGVVQVLVKPRLTIRTGKWQTLKWRRGIKDGVGGGRSPAPAKLCIERILTYLEKWPEATWNDIYYNVPNHYAHPESMAGSLRERIGRDIKMGGMLPWGPRAKEKTNGQKRLFE